MTSPASRPPYPAGHVCVRCRRPTEPRQRAHGLCGTCYRQASRRAHTTWSDIDTRLKSVTTIYGLDRLYWLYWSLPLRRRRRRP